VWIEKEGISALGGILHPYVPGFRSIINIIYYQPEVKSFLFKFKKVQLKNYGKHHSGGTHPPFSSGVIPAQAGIQSGGMGILPMFSHGLEARATC